MYKSLFDIFEYVVGYFWFVLVKLGLACMVRAKNQFIKKLKIRGRILNFLLVVYWFIVLQLNYKFTINNLKYLLVFNKNFYSKFEG